MTRDELREDLEDISGIGEATADEILGVLDSHHPDGSFDGFAEDGGADGVEEAVAVLTEESRSYSSRISMAVSLLGGDE